MVVTWRILLTLHNRREQVGRSCVLALRRVLAAARSNPDVIRYTYRRLRDVAGVVRETCPTCGSQYLPGTVTEWDCRCGLLHVQHECRDCGVNLIDPPFGRGNLPADPRRSP